MIQIGLAGDVMIGRLVNELLMTVPPEHIWGDILPLLRQTDFNLINLEAALTTSEEQVPKVFNFKADPRHVEVLKVASIGAVNLANNHVLDWGEKGLFETIETLTASGIGFFGAGRDEIEARRPFICEVKGVRIGILGCTDNEPSWQATPISPGVRYVAVGGEGEEGLFADIAALKSAVDLLILSIHWGPNMRERPPPHFVAFAHQLLDMGVDILHGHSAHIFQGVERVGKKWILYDTGDFIDDYAVDPFLRNDRSFLFLVTADKEGVVDLKMVPTRIDRCQVNRAMGRDREEALLRMDLLSKELLE